MLSLLCMYVNLCTIDGICSREWALPQSGFLRGDTWPPGTPLHAGGAPVLPHILKGRVPAALCSSPARLGGAREISAFWFWLRHFWSLLLLKPLAFCPLYRNTLKSSLQATFFHLALPTVSLMMFFISFSNLNLDAERMSPFLIQHPWTFVSSQKSFMKIKLYLKNFQCFPALCSDI